MTRTRNTAQCYFALSSGVLFLNAIFLRHLFEYHHKSYIAETQILRDTLLLQTVDPMDLISITVT